MTHHVGEGVEQYCRRVIAKLAHFAGELESRENIDKYVVGLHAGSELVHAYFDTLRLVLMSAHDVCGIKGLKETINIVSEILKERSSEKLESLLKELRDKIKQVLLY